MLCIHALADANFEVKYPVGGGEWVGGGIQPPLHRRSFTLPQNTPGDFDVEISAHTLAIPVCGDVPGGGYQPIAFFGVVA